MMSTREYEEYLAIDESRFKETAKGGSLNKFVAFIGLGAVAASVFAFGSSAFAQLPYHVNGEEFDSLDPEIIEETLVSNYHEDGIFADPDADEVLVDYDVDTDSLLDWGILKHSGVIDVQPSVSPAKLKNYIEKYNEDKDMPEDAVLNIDGTITPEVYGTVVSYEDVQSAVDSGVTGIVFSDYEVQPALKESDLADKQKELLSVLDWSIVYKNGYSVTVPDGYVSLDDEYNTVTDSSFLPEQIEALAASYSPDGTEEWTFRDHNGDDATVTGGTFGAVVDKEAEQSVLSKLFDSGASVEDRDPVMDESHASIGNTYVEVSIQDQHVWYHENGGIVMDSPCVTGNMSAGHGTPVGAYYVSERVPGKYLVGDGYKTWVNRWMRLTNSGVGLHDAGWRSSFGGTIYTYSGSHGCVNLPTSFAYELYDRIQTGVPVVIY